MARDGGMGGGAAPIEFAVQNPACQSFNNYKLYHLVE
jgi:hypothetical protein